MGNVQEKRRCAVNLPWNIFIESNWILINELDFLCEYSK